MFSLKRKQCVWARETNLTAKSISGISSFPIVCNASFPVVCINPRRSSLFSLSSLHYCCDADADDDAKMLLAKAIDFPSEEISSAAYLSIAFFFSFFFIY